MRESIEAAENLLGLAKAGCGAVFGEVTKILQKKVGEGGGGEHAYYWIDDESIRQTGLIPLGDAIMGLAYFLEALDEVGRRETRDGLLSEYGDFLKETARQFRLYCYARSADDVLTSDEPVGASPHFGGFPYVTSGHVRRRRRETNGESREDPEITVAVAYAVIVSRKVLADPEFWGQEREIWEDLFETSLERLFDIGLPILGTGGRGWAAFPRQELLQDEARPELFPSWMVCKALAEVPESHFQREAADGVRKAVVRWVVDSLISRSQSGGDARWCEYGTKGRSRLVDQVMALSIIFENADPSDLIRAQQPLGRVLLQLLQACLDPIPAEPDYHLFRRRDLVGLVPWEDFSLLFWTLALLLRINEWLRECDQADGKDQLASTLFDQTASVESMSERLVMDSVRSITQTPLARFVRRSMIQQHLEARITSNKQKIALWPREGFRVYASWAAINNLAVASKSDEFLAESERGDEVFLALFRTLRSNHFASGISDQVVDFMRRQYNLT